MCSKSAIFLESNNTNGEGSGLRNTWHGEKNLCTRPFFFFLETEVEQFLMSAICNAAISRNRIKYPKNTTRKELASNTIHLFQTFSVHSLRGRHKKGKEKRRERRLLPLSPIPLRFSLPPYPLPLSTPVTQATTYTESSTFADSGRVEQILSKTGSSYKLPTPGPPHRAKENWRKTASHQRQIRVKPNKTKK